MEDKKIASERQEKFILTLKDRIKELKDLNNQNESEKQKLYREIKTLNKKVQEEREKRFLIQDELNDLKINK